MSQSHTKIELLRQLGWSEPLLAELEKFEVSSGFGLNIENPIGAMPVEETDFREVSLPPLFSTKLVVMGRGAW